jgi:polyhydroxybutyrate depolymerase
LTHHRGRRALGVLLPAAGLLALALPLGPAPSAAAVAAASTSTTTITTTTTGSSGSSGLTGSTGCHRSASASLPVAPGRTGTLSLNQGAVTGTYALTVPPTYKKNRPAPLIFLFHGDGDNPADFSAKTNFPAQGARAGDLVVVPQNQGPEAGFQYSGRGTDATFVNSLINALMRSYCLNQRAVFTSGFSSGAAFAILYACAHQSQIRAIATVAVDYQLGCTRPEPLLALHGTADPAVTYQNNTVESQLPGIKLEAHSVKGTVRNMADWVKLDRCQPKTPTVTRIGSQVSRSQWLSCAPGTSVTFYTISGGGHEWPGAKVTTGVGFTTQQISANTLIINFFHSFT